MTSEVSMLSFPRSLVVVLVVALLLAAPGVAHAGLVPPADGPSPPVVEVAPAAADRPKGEEREREWEDKDHVRVGALLGLGYPRPVALEVMVKIERALGLGIEAGMMPPLTVGPLSTSFWGVAGDLRVFPFQGAFFIGMRAGYQRMKATATASVPGLGTLSESAVADTYFVNPRIGFLWTLESGVTLGLDVGVQVPIQKSYVDTLPDSVSSEVRGSLVGVANAFGYTVTPSVDLLRIGFLF